MTNKQLKKLIKRYTEAREEIIQRILSVKGVGTKTYYNTVLQELNKILKRLSKLSHEALETAIPEKYKQALDELYEQFKKNNLTMLPPNAFAQIHEDAVYDLVREAEYHTDDALSRVGRQVQRYMDTAKDEALRQAGLKASAQKIATVSTVTDMKNALEKELKDEGFMTVQYGEGEKAFQVPVETYVAMVSRSTTREAGNLARENQLTANGYDLVKMTEHYPTCKVCSALQGRVFSISGKDKRFRPLSDAFRSGYRNVHPNCRHAIGPWIERAYSPEEVEAESRKSLAPLDDARSPAERELYNKQQRQNREARQNYFQWERYRKRLGDDAPKSQLAFERIKKKGGEKWELMQLDYRRRSELVHHPERALPNATNATAADEKFTKYLFNPENKKGYAKGLAFSNRLGYNINNWRELQYQIINHAPLCPSAAISTDEYGTRYEQKMILYGKNALPANVIVAWCEKDGKTWLTSCYIKEAK